MKNEISTLRSWVIIPLLTVLYTTTYSQEARLVDLLRVDACSKYRYRIWNPTIARLTVQIDPGDGSPIIHTILPSGGTTYIKKKINRSAKVSAYYSEEHYRAELESYKRAIQKIVRDADAASAIIEGIQEGVRSSPDVTYQYVEDWYGNAYIREQNHGFNKLLLDGFAELYDMYQQEEAKKQVIAIGKKAAQAEKLYAMSDGDFSSFRMVYDEVVKSNRYRPFNPGFVYDFALVSIIGNTGLNETWNIRRGSKMTFSFGLPGEIRWGRNSSIFTRFYLDGVYETLKFNLRETGEYYLSADLLEGTGQADLAALSNNENINLRGRRFGGGGKVRTQFGNKVYANISGGIMYSTKAKLIFDDEVTYFNNRNIRLKELKVDDLASLDPEISPYLAAEVGLLANKAGQGCNYYAQGISFFLGGQVSRGQFVQEGDIKISQNIDNEVVPAPFESSSQWLYNVWLGIGVNF